MSPTRLRLSGAAALSSCLLAVLSACAIPENPGPDRVTGTATRGVDKASAPAGRASTPPSPNPSSKPSRTTSAAGHWTAPRLTPGDASVRRPALPKPRSTSGATLRLTGNWDASAELIGSAEGRVRCSHFEHVTGRQYTYLASSDPAAMDIDALGIGENEYAVAVQIGPDGVGEQSAKLVVAATDRSRFDGYAANREIEPSIPLIYEVSKDYQSVQVAAKVVTGPSYNYRRAEDIGWTAITLSLRCPK